MTRQLERFSVPARVERGTQEQLPQVSLDHDGVQLATHAEEPTHLNQTRSSMLQRLKEGDAGEWRKLNTICARMVYGWCRKLGIQATDAQDIAQEVLVTVSQSIGKFHKENEGDTFHGWLFTITKRKVLDRGRLLSQGRGGIGGSDHQLRMTQLEEEISSSSAIINHGLSRKMLQAIDLVRAEVSEQSWIIFWRTEVEGASVAQVAEDLAVKSGTVRTAKHRVGKRLKEKFGVSQG